MQHTEGKYTNEFKLEVLEKVEKYGIQETSKIVSVRASTIDGWAAITAYWIGLLKQQVVFTVGGWPW